MEKLSQVWAVAENGAEISYLVSAARALGESVVLVYSGGRDEAAGADRALWLGAGDGRSFADIVPWLAGYIGGHAPQLVLCPLSGNGRLLAGALAARLRTNVLSDAKALRVEGGRVVSERLVYGGAAVKTQLAGGSAVACIGPGLFPELSHGPCGETEELSPCGCGIALAGRKAAPAARTGLHSAKYVVAAGRGASGDAELALAGELAGALGAEMGCTRPVAEEDGKMPKETYIGVSGAIIKPKLYIALGISGQVQHMVGVEGAGRILAINKDRNAAIFSQCDCGLVADAAQVLPGITERLK